ncbi:MAG: shikimate dehydrogenase [Planctomycetia bacterium]|nr:shikimate dehydrogenase [Planctomycetia bacterium]
MICVIIACGSHRRMIEEHQKLAEDGIELVELRLDFLRKEPEIYRLLPNRPTNVIVTIRRREDGGQWRDTEDRRQRILRSVIADGVEFVDLELDIAKKIPRFGSTKRIISYHNLEETPENLDLLRDELLKCDADIVKIAVTPKNINDVYRMIEFLKRVNKPGVSVPTLGISMTELGAMTRLLGKKYGAPFGFASFSETRTIAPGMMYYKTLRDLYRYENVDSHTEVFGVVGDPIGHSLSPLIHNASFGALNLNKIYLPFRMPGEELSPFIDRAQEIDLKGLSVTIPHKVAVIKKLTQLDPAVEEIDACNTIILDGYSRFGYNTDYLAAVLSIETAMGLNPDGTSPLDGKKALVLGAGGAGKAIAFGLIEKGARVIISDIKDEMAEKLANQLHCDFCTWETRNSYVVQILANCTPVGMFPNVNETPMERSALRGGMFVFDAVYNPENTLLLKQARDKGCTTISGIEMFVGQACLQFKLFTGRKASASFMRGLVKKTLSPVHD